MKAAILGDLHLNSPKFETHIRESFSACLNQIEKWKPDRVILAGDVLDRAVLNPETTDYLTYMFTNLKNLTDQVDIVVGNHDYNPQYRMYAVEFLRYIDKIDILTTSTEGINKTLYIPHRHDGYKIGEGERWNTCIAHLGMRGVDIRPGSPYVYSDILRTDEELPRFTFLGHIHTPFEAEIDGSTVIGLGSISPVTWGDVSDQRYMYLYDMERVEILERWPIPHIRLHTISSTYEPNERSKYDLYRVLAEDGEKPPAWASEVVYSRNPKNPFMYQELYGNLHDIVDNNCKQANVEYRRVMNLLKGYGMID